MAKGFIIAAPSSGSGKTVTTLGLIAALRAQRLTVAAAKTGPDYLDPMYLAAANGGSPAINLDPWAMSEAQMTVLINQHSSDADLLAIEGVMGLFDGGAGGAGSTASLAKTLNLPVILVVDASGHAQSLAAIAHGFRTLDPEVNVAGVIAVKTAGERHQMLIRDALETASIPCFGCVDRNKGMDIPSRHLGLLQAQENNALASVIEEASATIAASIDLDAILSLAKSPDLSEDMPTATSPLGQYISIARDAAFSFIYEHQLMTWRAQGASLSFFSPLGNEAPSAHADAIYLPGGYPELHGEALANADRFKSGMTDAAARGVKIYGECGGYMVLGETLTDKDHAAHPMLGLLSHSTSFAERKLSLGYRALSAQTDLLGAHSFRGHEFHYSVQTDTGTDAPLFEARALSTGDVKMIGGQRRTVMGSYAHIIAPYDRAPSP